MPKSKAVANIAQHRAGSARCQRGCLVLSAAMAASFARLILRALDKTAITYYASSTMLTSACVRQQYSRLHGFWEQSQGHDKSCPGYALPGLNGSSVNRHALSGWQGHDRLQVAKNCPKMGTNLPLTIHLNP